MRSVPHKIPRDKKYDLIQGSEGSMAGVHIRGGARRRTCRRVGIDGLQNLPEKSMREGK